MLNDCCTERLLAQKRVTRALQPLPLATERELHATLKCIEVNAAAGDQPGPRPRSQFAGQFVDFSIHARCAALRAAVLVVPTVFSGAGSRSL